MCEFIMVFLACEFMKESYAYITNGAPFVQEIARLSTYYKHIQSGINYVFGDQVTKRM